MLVNFTNCDRLLRRKTAESEMRTFLLQVYTILKERTKR